MPGSNKTNKSGLGNVISPSKSQVTQDFEESSNSSSQNTSDHSGLRAQQDGNKRKYSNLGENTLLQNTDNSTDDGS